MMIKLSKFSVSILIIHCIILSGCNKKQIQEQIAEEEVPDSGVVTVIFHDVEGIKPHAKPTYPAPSLSVYNGYYTDKKGGISKRTFDFELYTSQALINYNHTDKYTYSYPVHPGDTISIRFEKGIPIATSSDKKLKEYDLNLSAHYNLSKLHNTKFDVLTSIAVPFVFPEEERVTQEEYQAICDNKTAYIDSLLSHNLLSSNILELRKKEVETDKTSIRCYNPDYEYTEESFDDEKLPFSSYNSYTNVYTSTQYGKKHNHQSIKIFDDIVTENILPEKTKLNQLYSLLTNIGAEAMTEDFEAKKEQFLQLVKDTIWSSLVEKIPYMRTSNSKEMILYDQNMDQISLQDITDRHKGKVIYIDLWASWCGPCLASLPAGEKLRNKLADKPIIFLYLAYNDIKEPWLEKVKLHKLDKNNAETYLIASLKADWLKEMDVKSIPRYIIYDKKGKLVDKNAPSPKADNIEDILNNLINQ